MAELTLFHGVLLFILIAFASFVDCTAGGGGMITIPSYLNAGVPVNLVIGTDKLSSTVGISFAVTRLIKHFKINWVHAAVAIVVSLSGAMIGAHLSHYLTHLAVVIMLLILMPLLLFLNNWLQYNEEGELHSGLAFFIKYLVISFVFSGYDGFFGPGTGTFMFLAYIFLTKMPARIAVMHAKLINFTANLGALIFFLFVGRIAWIYAAIGVPAAIFGYLVGSHFVVRVNLKWLRLLVNIVIIALIIRLLIENFGLLT